MTKINNQLEDDDFDENGVLRDGGKLTVRMLLMDAVDDVQRAIITDALGRPAGQRPGPIYGPKVANDARDLSYQRYEEHLVDAWRSPEQPPIEAEGNKASVEDAYRAHELYLQNAWRGG